MKKYKTLILLILITIGLFFLIKSRRIDKKTHNIMVLSNKNRIYQSCIKLTEFKMGKSKEKPYEYFSGVHIRKLCDDKEKMDSIVQEHMKEYYRDNWLFVY
ncbi:hypothetical protein [uncultured Polaribacter sp.]|uniref:hypothetical protein n=1 Tax=uncultured Polaribacter sp. TaxID=174711 RepID=UPI00263744C9|nr:hypothetical protein [uncultured Polaribacter sp.]